MTSNNTAANTLRAAVEKAASAWDGITWDTDLEGVATAAREGRLDDVEGIGTWMARDGSSDSQQHLRRLRELREMIEGESTGEEIAALAEELHAEERAYVERRAKQAASEGEAAVQAVACGDWGEAIERLQSACAIEREFGDDPAWSRALLILEALHKEAKDADLGLIESSVAELGETGAAKIERGGLYVRREENCDWLYCGPVQDAESADTTLDEVLAREDAGEAMIAGENRAYLAHVAAKIRGGERVDIDGLRERGFRHLATEIEDHIDDDASPSTVERVAAMVEADAQ